jgi:hypothetical protein
MNAPLAVAALILWLLLAFLAIRVCRRWAKEQNTVSVIYKNHPAIPVKQYSLANVEGDLQPAIKPEPLAINQTKLPLTPERNVWDI